MYQPIYCWNGKRAGMTNEGIMCITKSTDDSTLWKLETTEKGTSILNKKTQKYAHAKPQGGPGSCSDTPHYYNIREADLFVNGSDGLVASYENTEEQIYNKAHAFEDTETKQFWNIYQDQKGDGAWIISYEFEVQAKLKVSFGEDPKFNETWRIGKQLPNKFTGLLLGLEFNFWKNFV